MQHSAAPASSPVSRSFSGILTDIAVPQQKFPPARDFDGLTDDIATLSYEHALRTHARYRPEHVDDKCVGSPGPQPPSGALSSAAVDQASMRSPQPVAGAIAAGTDRDRKNASITVRLSSAENDQLRERAAEAGMTLSAYLRSCAFEVENLRSQVKQTLADLRRSKAPEVQSTSALSKFIPWRRRVAPAAQS
jgi:hypothetical protein